ncbi:hypothetical protein, partial [Sphingomonas sp. 10B4]|uniref:hypothetical protein n=1 Tax=Sphingomonas sp. 10B4 TaxID=3048575 RepID=UPI002B2237F3
GLGITPIYPTRFPTGIPNVSFATKPVHPVRGIGRNPVYPSYLALGTFIERVEKGLASLKCA